MDLDLILCADFVLSNGAESDKLRREEGWWIEGEDKDRWIEGEDKDRWIEGEDKDRWIEGECTLTRNS